MLIKELNMNGFGKFKNENIVLKEKINLIYGENEAGKSTLHSFIHGMFYGFLKVNAKSALYLDEHDKYNPWNNSRYGGIIHFEHEGKSYRIEREFTKGKESTKVLDESTGSDITKSIDCGPNRIKQPGIHFFGFNTRVFSNTISIKQLESKTDDKLANEVSEKLINVTTALDDNISVDKSILELKGKIAEIGTDRAHTKPYAINLNEIETLEKEQRKILQEKHNYEFYLEEGSRLEDNLLLEDKKLIDLKGKLSNIESVEKMKILQEAQILRDEILNIEKKIAKLSPYSGLSMDKYKEGLNLNNSMEFINKRIHEDKIELETIETKLRNMDEDKDNINLDKIEEMTKDYDEYEELENQKKEIIYNKDHNILELIKRDHKSYEDKVSKNKIMLVLCFILSAITMTSIIVIKQYIIKKYFIIGFLMFSIANIYILIILKKHNTNLSNAKIQIDKIEDNDNNKKVKVEEIEKLQNDLLNKYNVNTKMEFKRLIDLKQRESDRKKNHMELYNELKTKKDSLINKIEDEESKKEENYERLKDILNESNVEDLEELSDGLDKKNQYEKNSKELEVKKEFLIRTLGENTIENLATELEDIDIQVTEYALDKNQLKYEIERSKESIQDLKIALKGVEENLNILGKDISRLVEIEEELVRKIIYKEELDGKINSLELAVQTIEEISKDIHSQFAPEINKKVSEIVNKITTGKYTNIKITESFKISVENPETKEIIKIENLSGGTIDQLYFSLRFGIINSMVENRLPLILDDCFIQYDDIRLTNIIKFLEEVGNERQIILFTCHNREKRLLDELGVEFNYIELT